MPQIEIELLEVILLVWLDRAMRQQEATLNIITVLELIDLLTLPEEVQVVVEVLISRRVLIGVTLHLEGLQTQTEVVLMEDHQDQVEVLLHLEDHPQAQEVAVLLEGLLLQVAGLQAVVQEAVHHVGVEVVDNIKST